VRKDSSFDWRKAEEEEGGGVEAKVFRRSKRRGRVVLTLAWSREAFASASTSFWSSSSDLELIGVGVGVGVKDKVGGGEQGSTTAELEFLIGGIIGSCVVCCIITLGGVIRAIWYAELEKLEKKENLNLNLLT